MSKKFKSYEEFAQFVGPEPRCVLAARGGCEAPEGALPPLAATIVEAGVQRDEVKALFPAHVVQDAARPLER